MARDDQRPQASSGRQSPGGGGRRQAHLLGVNAPPAKGAIGRANLDGTGVGQTSSGGHSALGGGGRRRRPLLARQTRARSGARTSTLDRRSDHLVRASPGGPGLLGVAVDDLTSTGRTAKSGTSGGPTSTAPGASIGSSSTRARAATGRGAGRTTEKYNLHRGQQPRRSGAPTSTTRRSKRYSSSRTRRGRRRQRHVYWAQSASGARSGAPTSTGAPTASTRASSAPPAGPTGVAVDALTAASLTGGDDRRHRPTRQAHGGPTATT